MSANAYLSGDTVILIPTYRRPASLAVALDSISDEAAACGACVIVGDNECSDAVRQSLAARDADVKIVYLPVPARGVSQVRNALIAEAFRRLPEWRWLIMLDDDGIAASNLIATIVACGERFGADLVGGPVEGVLPADAGTLARNSIFARRTRSLTGPVALLNTTQNLAIARRLFDRIHAPLFDPRYGASGGEDYDLFRRVAKAGGTMVWCDEAIVTEPAPADRLTPRAILHRYYSTGMYMSPIDRSYDGGTAGLIAAAKGLVRGAIEVAIGGVVLNRDRIALGVLRVAHHSGRVGGLIGRRSARYVASGAAS